MMKFNYKNTTITSWLIFNKEKHLEVRIFQMYFG